MTYAAKRGIEVAPQRTGHNAEPLGSLADVILVRTDAMRGVEIDEQRPVARVLSGTKWAGRDRSGLRLAARLGRDRSHRRRAGSRGNGTCAFVPGAYLTFGVGLEFDPSGGEAVRAQLAMVEEALEPVDTVAATGALPSRRPARRRSSTRTRTPACRGSRRASIRIS